MMPYSLSWTIRERKFNLLLKNHPENKLLFFFSSNLIETIMEDTNTHIFQINNLLKNIKSTLHAEFICPCPGGVSIITNNIPNLSDLAIMKKHFKSIEDINTNKILAPRLLNRNTISKSLVSHIYNQTEKKSLVKMLLTS